LSTADDITDRLRLALQAAGHPGAAGVLERLRDKGLAHDHVRIVGTGSLARMPKQSQMGLGALDNLAYQRACFERAAAGGHTPALLGWLPPSQHLPRGALLVHEVVGRAARLPADLGAIAAARSGTIPKKCFVVAMETSSERPFAKMGDGPILRVGDKASTFTHAVTAHCHEVAKDLATKDKGFKFQRKLMDGGTCESSAYCTLGYEATGLCIALGNYHNVDEGAKKIGPEYVDLNDFANAVKWFVALAVSPIAYNGRDETLEKQINGLERDYRRLLHSTVKAAR